MAKTRIGFVGVGFMGQQAHLRNYVCLPDCEVVAIAEPRAKLRAAVAARYGIANVYQDHRELLDRCPVDAIVASQPYHYHAALIPEILARKTPVFTEKPIAVSVEAGQRLAQCAADNGTLYMVGYHKRSDPAMEYARQVISQWLASGECGRLRLVRASMPPGDWIAGGGQGYISTDDPYPAIAGEPKPTDMDEETFQQYNAFVNYYIHQINALRWLLGEPYKPVYADPSAVVMVGQSDSGVCAVLEMAAYHTTVDWQESYLVAFERGTVHVELPAPLAAQQAGQVRVLRDPGDAMPTVTMPILPKRHAMLNQAANFVAAVRGERPAPCEAAEAVEDLKVARDYIRLMRGLT